MVRSGRISATELKRRATRLRLILTDNDGVLTDTGVYYGEHGESFKRFSIRDGMGVELLRNHGVDTAIITSEASPSVRRRAEKLTMPYLYLGVKDKAAHLDVILKETGLRITQLGYIGDDVNDLAMIRLIGKSGITAAPADAMEIVSRTVHYRCTKPGGHGAFRDFADWIIRQRQKNLIGNRGK